MVDCPEFEPLETTKISAEHIYPIARLNDDCLLIMYQASYDNLELWIWNKNDKKAYRELSSIFLPSYVRLLPDNKAFSFIDHGRIRIKSFQKRAPRVIDIHETINEISSLKWISNDQFYFVGKQKDNFSIFLCDISDRDVTLYSLHNQDSIDRLYPCKINSSLFYITKNESCGHCFCKTAWNPQLYGKNQLLFEKQSETLLKNDCSLCFLHMEDESNGFVLEYDNQSKDNDLFTLSCCSLTLIDHTWKLEKLFEFTLPLKLLTGTDKTRLYESIDPFLPSYSAHWIYFVTYDQLLEKCKVLRYNKELKTIEEMESKTRSFDEFSHVFAPLVVDGNVYFGFTHSSTRGINNALQINEANGSITCLLPEIENKGNT